MPQNVVQRTKRRSLTSDAVEVDVHVVGEGSAAMDVLLGDVQSAGRSPHASLADVRHLASVLSRRASAVILRKATALRPLPTPLHPEPRPHHLDDRVPRALRRDHRGSEAAPAGKTALGRSSDGSHQQQAEGKHALHLCSTVQSLCLPANAESPTARCSGPAHPTCIASR